MITPIEVPTLKKAVTKKPWDRPAKKEPEKKKGFEVQLKKAVKHEDRATESPPTTSRLTEMPSLKKTEQQERPKIEAAKLETVALKETEKPKSAFEEVSPWHKHNVYSSNWND